MPLTLCKTFDCSMLAHCLLLSAQYRVPTSAGQLATLPRVRHSFLLNGPDPVRHAGKWVIQRRMLPRCYLLPLKLSTMLNTFFNGLTMCQHVGLDNGQRMTKNTFVGSLQGKLKKPHLHIHQVLICSPAFLFSDQKLSVVRRRCRRCRRQLFTFSSSSLEPLGQFQPNL